VLKRDDSIMGQLVRHRWLEEQIGIVTEWYDSVKGYVYVTWWLNGRITENPCHISKLEVISGD